MEEQKELRELVNQSRPQVKFLPADCPKFPIKTVDGFKTLEQYLQDKENFRKIVSILYIHM